SLGALIPGITVSALVLVMGVFSLLNTCALTVAIGRSYRAKPAGLWSRERVSGIGLILGSLYIYGAEIWWGVQTISVKGDVTFAFVASLLLFSFGLALVRAWSLLGARRNSIGDLVGSLLQDVSGASHASHSDRTSKATAPDATMPTVPTVSATSAPASVPLTAPTAKTTQTGATQ
ncbi:MAG: hypothetical protein ABI068_04415, partial [Ktedonobacterales bacterium]